MKKIKAKDPIGQHIIFAPGPTMTPDWVWNAITTSHLHHNMSSYRDLVVELNQRMSALFGVKEGTMVFLSGSGSDMMERSLAGFVGTATRVSVINTGYFADRWHTMAKKYSHAVTELLYERGTTYSLEELKKSFLSSPPDVVLMQATDTGTGIRNDPRPVAQLLRRVAPNSLFIVDAVLEAGISPIKMDHDGIDILVGSTQKAFMLPPGLGFIIMKRRALNKLTLSQKSFVLDLADEVSFAQRAAMRYTPPVSHLAGLRAVLRHIEKKGEAQWYQECHDRAMKERAFFGTQGFTLFTKDAASNGLSVLTMPEGKNAIALAANLEKNHHLFIAAGLGKETDSVIRIAHFAGIQEKDWSKLHGAMKKIFRS